MRLKELRLLNQLTQQEVAKQVGITQFTYSNYENKKTQPDLATLFKLADLYNVSLDYLLEHEQENQFDLGYLTDDQKTAIKMLTALNHINFIKAFSYISGLYASQN